ncbi:hypothetical protein ABFX02_13G056500 [Erythranthe guttata]
MVVRRRRGFRHFQSLITTNVFMRSNSNMRRPFYSFRLGFLDFFLDMEILIDCHHSHLCSMRARYDGFLDLYMLVDFNLIRLVDNFLLLLFGAAEKGRRKKCKKEQPADRDKDDNDYGRVMMTWRWWWWWQNGIGRRWNDMRWRWRDGMRWWWRWRRRVMWRWWWSNRGFWWWRCGGWWMRWGDFGRGWRWRFCVWWCRKVVWWCRREIRVFLEVWDLSHCYIVYIFTCEII